MLPSAALAAVMVTAAMTAGPPIVKAMLCMLALVILLGGAVAGHR